MSTHDKPRVTSEEVLNRIRIEIEAPHGSRPDSAISARVARIRDLQREFRVEQLGGRLLPIKRIFHWFVASTFDRQAKVIEELLNLVRDLGDEIEHLRIEVRQLRMEMDERRRGAHGSGETTTSSGKVRTAVGGEGRP